MQLLWMVMISGPILICFSFFIEDPIRDFQIIHIWGLLFSVYSGCCWRFFILVVVIIKISSFWCCQLFFFNTNIYNFFGWLILSEVMTPDFIFAAFLVITGLILINK